MVLLRIWRGAGFGGSAGLRNQPLLWRDGGKAGTAVSHLSSASLLFAGRGVGAVGVNRTREP